jgi:hypothetical protein
MLAWGDMFVWGDQVRVESPQDKLGHVRESLQQVARLPAGIERHAALVAAFIDAGELAQGLADARWVEAGCDAWSAVDIRAMALLARIAAAVRASWDSGFARQGPSPEQKIRALRVAPLPMRCALSAQRASRFIRCTRGVILGRPGRSLPSSPSV